MPIDFNDTSPEHLEYRNGVMRIAVLGGIRLEGLDRMRVTLKVEVEHLAVRHNLDLYNDNQVEKLVRKLAGKLEVGTSVISATLAELTDLLEQYRLKEREKLLDNTEYRRKLSDQQYKKAKKYLSEPNLMARTSEDIGKSGVVGEEHSRLLMYIIFASRKRDEPLHVISHGSSGIGKTHLQTAIGDLVPEEDKITITALSENAFYYFGRRELKNKLILIEDLDGAESVMYPLRELQTKRVISKTVVHKNSRGESRSIHLRVEGPVSVAGCTTRERLYEDNANRSFLIYIDESEEQDERVMGYQRRKSAGKIDRDEQERIKRLLQNCQHILQPIKVINPYAELLKIPKEVLKPRRTNKHYLHFVEAVTFYHQWQRPQRINEETGEVYIETTIEDIEEANKLMKQVLLRKSDELSGACRNYFERLKLHLKQEGEESYRNTPIRLAFRIPATTLRRYQGQLLECGYIKIIKGKKSTGYTYAIRDEKEYEELRRNIESVLDQILESVKAQELKKDLVKA